MKNRQNISDLLEKIKPDFIGFIFYPKSKRYVVNEKISNFISEIQSAKKVGVFVNEKGKNILKYVREYKLDYIQLHGDETPEYCRFFYNEGFKIIKAFQVNENFDFSQCEAYQNVCDYFLFDTKSEKYGGSGKQFNWELLENYKADNPYFLSGGISTNDVESIKKIKDNRLAVIDINSKFENKNGLKNIEEIKLFTQLSTH